MKKKTPPARKRRKSPPRPIGEAERRILRQAEAIKLRAVDKMTYRQIAEELKVSVRTAYDLVHEATEEVKLQIEKHGFDITVAKFEAVETLQAVIGKWFKVATAPAVFKETLEDGTVVMTDAADTAISAAHVVVNAGKEIAKLLGLNAPVRVQGKIDVKHHEPQPLGALAERVAKLTQRTDIAGTIARAYAEGRRDEGGGRN